MISKLVSRSTRLALSFVFIFALGASPALAEDSPGRTLVGTWEVLIVSDVLPPARDVTVVNRDGSLSNSDAILGTGHGAWKRLGDTRFKTTFLTPVLATNPLGFPAGSMLTVTATVDVNVGGMSASGPFGAVIELTDPATGAEITLFEFNGVVFFTRITVDH